MGVRCPSCFHPLTPDRYAWSCDNASCRVQPDPAATRLAGFAVSTRQIIVDGPPPELRGRWEPPEYVFCTTCGQPTRVQVCPVCHYGPLPADWRSANITCIAMAGARFTGKSFFIAIAIKQLELLCIGLRAAMDFAGENTKAIYTTHYEKPLYQERGIIPPTPSIGTDNPYQREPLIISLGLVKGRRNYLAIRDIAGEDLENVTGRPDHFQFLAHADGVFFLYDPIAVPPIRAALRGFVDQHQAVGGDPRLVLNNVLRLIDRGSPRLAVIMSKFDVMHELRSVRDTSWSLIMSNAGSAMMRDPGFVQTTYDDHDGGLVHEEIRSLLLTLGADSFVLALEEPTNGHRLDYRYFGVSVLGEIPTDIGVHSRGIAPFRCLDALRWVFASTGVL